MALPIHAGLGGSGMGGKVRKPLKRKNPGPVTLAGATRGRDIDRVQGNRVAAMQRFLRSRGYNVALDGRRGPQTESALADWHSGVNNRNPNAWNREHVRIEDPQRSNSPRNSNNQAVVKNQKPDTKNSNPGNRATPATKSGRTGQVVMPPGPSENSPEFNFDPETYITNLIEAKYGPLIAEIDRRRSYIESSGRNRAAEIRDMYGTYVGGMRERGAEANAERLMLAEATKGLAGAIGGAIPMGEAAASELAVRGDIESDYAGLMGQSASDFDRRMQEAAGAGSAFAASQALREADVGVSEIDAQKRDILGQRGADLASSRDDLMRWQQEVALKERELEGAQASDRIKNQMALLELKAAMSAMPMESKKAELELQRLMAEIGYTQAQTDKIRRTPIPKPKNDKGFPKNFGGLSPVDKDALGAQIAQSLTNSSSASDATRRVKARLRMLGYDPDTNPAVAQFGYNLARSFFPQDTSKRWWGIK